MTTTDAPKGAFHVSVQPSGRSFDTLPDESVLSGAIRQGVGLPYGCKDGVCGSCKCKLLSGQVHMDNYQEKALSAAEQASGIILTCRAQPESDLVLESRQVTEVGALPIKKMPVRVTSLTRKSDDVMLMQLQLPANDSFAYRAGQYVEFILRDGLRRSYSMASAATGNTLELHIRHLPGGVFTDQVFGSMKERDILRIEGPFGSFYLREDSSKPIILLASGTGFAPVKALLEHMQQKAITRETTLYWGGRRPSDLYQQDWIEAQLPAMPHLRYVPVVSDALAQDHWSGRTGFVHRAVLQDFADLSGHQVYACGAPIVIDSARADFTALVKLPPDEFFADAFTSAADRV